MAKEEAERRALELSETAGQYESYFERQTLDGWVVMYGLDSPDHFFSMIYEK